MPFAARVGIVVLVSLGLIDRLEVDATVVLAGSVVSCLALAGSAVPVWWWEPAWSVERLVGLAQDESRTVASRAGWLETQA